MKIPFLSPPWMAIRKKRNGEWNISGHLDTKRDVCVCVGVLVLNTFRQYPELRAEFIDALRILCDDEEAALGGGGDG